MKFKWIITILVISIIIVIGLIIINNNTMEPIEEYISFSIQQDLEVEVGSYEEIQYTLDDKDLTIEWKSSDETVVTVDNSGYVYGVGLGNALIIATAKTNDRTITKVCSVTTYYGDINVKINDINVPDGELFLSKGDEYHLNMEYVPSNSYINKVNYRSNDESVVTFNDGTIQAVDVGVTNVVIVVNDSFIKDIRVNVLYDKFTPTFGNKLNSVSVIDKIDLEVGESKKINYTILPEDAFIYNIKWETSDSNIELDGSIVKAKDKGNAKVSLTINNITKVINVTVKKTVTGIKVTSKSNVSLKIGGTSKIKVQVLPEDAENQSVTYKSSNSNVIVVSKEGKVTAVGAGTALVTIKTKEGGYSTTVVFTVKSPESEQETVVGNGKIWGYDANNVVNPVYAGINFFTTLAQQGKGTLSNNIYTINTSQGIYSYNISTSVLEHNNRKVLMRFYYPPSTDLSKVNTFTFFGGSYEHNFGSYFSAIQSDTSLIRSGGIIILVSCKYDYDGWDGVYATDFVKQIVSQKSSAKNTVGGYSRGGPAAADAFERGGYTKLFIIDSFFEDVSAKTKLANSELIFFSPIADDMYNYTLKTLNSVRASGYKHVTIITNNGSLINQFGNIYKIDNPGDAMGHGHSYNVITKSNLFAYACS